MTRESRPRRPCHVLGALLLAAALCGCGREVTVADPRAGTDLPVIPAEMAAGRAAGAAAPASGGAPASPVYGTAGSAAGAPAAAPLADAGDAGAAAGNSLMEGIDQIATREGSSIDEIQILALFLSAIELPAVGSDGVSLGQYYGTDQAATLYVDWNGVVEFWHLMSRAHYIDTAASLGRHVGLLHAMGSYGIHEGNDPAEISGSPASYKEFLAANPDGFAWVDYPARTLGGGPPAAGGDAFGEIVFRTWTGARSTLSDALRYRARLELSDTHVAFVEYADTAAGTPGQIVVRPIAGGEALAVAPSANHQDRPAIDGDWVVWEEYVGGQDAVIRGRNLATGEVRDVSSASAFRTNPDILGTRVVWEDQRGGNGDIYFADLDDGRGERVAVSGPGHSAAVRLSQDGLVWIESADGNIALLRAQWTAF